ncbi:MAG TPA: HAD family hydrolase [Pseudobacteroides sp.]|uniref:HAD family hydrolase n=1 Tax=Pseudobacteroides sp. TaxID=1968840 RepID=UPI002F944515
MKLYISDMDGTLLNKDKEISSFSKDVINALISKGGYFSIASARTAATALKILEGINLNVPISLMNGVVIYNTSKAEYEKVEELGHETSKKIISILTNCRVNGLMYTISENRLNTYYECLSSKILRDFVDERIKKYNKSFERVQSLLDKINKINKIIYFTLLDEYEPLVKVQDQLQDLAGIETSLYHDVYSEKTYLLEIYSSNASKYNAVKYLREKYYFDQVIGFGDNYNDIPMLKACSQFYAVDNAVGELKELATGVIGDNNSDGVARFIKLNEDK